MTPTWDAIAPHFDAEGLTADAPAFVALVRSALDGGDALAHASALADLTRGLTRAHLATRVLTALSRASEVAARRLALELATRLPPPLDPALTPQLTLLLRDRRLAAPLLVAAASALVRFAERDRQHCLRVWTDMAEGYGKRRLLADQAKLRKRFARPRQFDYFCAFVRRRMRIKCPRCKARMASAKMPRHLWSQHGRILDEGRARKPWQYLDAGPADGDPAVRLIALSRLMQRHRLRDVSARDRLCANAVTLGCGVCPHCWGRVPVGGMTPKCDISDGRLVAHGYCVEVCDGLFGSRLRVTTPAGVAYDGPEPGGKMPAAAARVAAAISCVALAALAAIAFPEPFALLGTGAALFAALVVWRRARRTRKRLAPDRVIDHAWRFLAFDPERGRVPPCDAEFLAALSRTSVGRGDPVARAATVHIWAEALDPTAAGVWAAFQALEAADILATGGDPVPRVAGAIGAGFTGNIPFGAAVALAALAPQATWTPEDQVRLRVLLLDRAFSARLGVWDLHEIGVALPALESILGSDDADRLARLHHLWVAQSLRPWSRCGPAATVFEVANYPDLAREHIGEARDLLLYLPLRSDGEVEAVILCGRGIQFRKTLMHDRSVPITFWPRANANGGGYEMAFGAARLAFGEPPERIATRLNCWTDYWFREFLPRVGESLEVPAGKTSRTLLASIATKCPECGKRSVAAVGRVGFRLK